jgi:hypothetical protein
MRDEDATLGALEVLETYRLAVANVPGAGREVDPLALLCRLRRRAALAVEEIEDEEERARLLVELQGIGRARVKEESMQADDENETETATAAPVTDGEPVGNPPGRERRARASRNGRRPSEGVRGRGESRSSILGLRRASAARTKAQTGRTTDRAPAALVGPDAALAAARAALEELPVEARGPALAYLRATLAAPCTDS